MKTDNGGPAFPGTNEGIESNAGMSLRDWFAGQAIGFLVREYCIVDDAPEMSELAYKVADAMLAERNKLSARSNTDPTIQNHWSPSAADAELGRD